MKRKLVMKQKEAAKLRTYNTKWTSLSSKADSLSKNLVDPTKAEKKNVTGFLDMLANLGELEDMPPV